MSENKKSINNRSTLNIQEDFDVLRAMQANNEIDADEATKWAEDLRAELEAAEAIEEATKPYHERAATLGRIDMAKLAQERAASPETREYTLDPNKISWRHEVKPVVADLHVSANGLPFFFIDVSPQMKEEGKSDEIASRVVHEIGMKVDFPAVNRDELARITNDHETPQNTELIPYVARGIDPEGVNHNHFRGLVLRDAFEDGTPMFILDRVVPHAQEDAQVMNIHVHHTN